MYFLGSTKYEGKVEVDALDYRRAVAVILTPVYLRRKTTRDGAAIKDVNVVNIAAIEDADVVMVDVP